MHRISRRRALALSAATAIAALTDRHALAQAAELTVFGHRVHQAAATGGPRCQGRHGSVTATGLIPAPLSRSGSLRAYGWWSDGSSCGLAITKPTTPPERCSISLLIS